MSELYLVFQDATNAVLVGCLTRLGWTPEQFAYHLNRLARSLRPAVPEISPKTPWRWLTARPPATKPCVPRQPWPGLIASLLSRHLREPVTLASLGWQASAGALFVLADDGLHHPWTPLHHPWTPPGAIASLHEVLETIGMDRRHFVALTGTGLTTFAHDWMLDPARVAAAARGQRVDHAVVDDLERVVDARRRLDDRFGGGMVFRVVREDLLLVNEMLDNSSYTEEIGRRLYAVAAEFARIAGLRAYDNNDEALAQRFFIAGLRSPGSSCVSWTGPAGPPPRRAHYYGGTTPPANAPASPHSARPPSPTPPPPRSKTSTPNSPTSSVPPRSDPKCGWCSLTHNDQLEGIDHHGQARQQDYQKWRRQARYQQD